MTDRADRLRVEDMQEAVERSLRYVGERSFEAFAADDLRVPELRPLLAALLEHLPPE